MIAIKITASNMVLETKPRKYPIEAEAIIKLKREDCSNPEAIHFLLPNFFLYNR